MAKMTNDQLKILQALPLDIKIRKTEIRIREWYEHWEGGVYVSFSGGKDSTVLLDIVRRLYPDVPAVFSDTGLEYPEIKEFVKTFPNVTIVRPKHSFKQILTKYGYPIISKEIAECVHHAKNFILQETGQWGGYPNSKTLLDTISMSKLTVGGRDREYRKMCGLGEYAKPKERVANILELKDKQGNIRKVKEGEKSAYSCEKYQWLLNADFLISSQCCYHMKKSPLHRFEKESNLKPIIATMADEGRQRKMAWLRTGCNAFEGKIQSKPMSFWTEQDVYEYIVLNNLPIAKVYGDVIKNDKDVYETTGVNRTGWLNSRSA